ncbi:MAG: hypothetical protein PHR25_05680 [Clostridia bacterium]|nr:hypothetical protein [Clostridia bacterium]MDD4376255.1 hypothetical protein [Clostridia bacterium]
MENKKDKNSIAMGVMMFVFILFIACSLIVGLWYVIKNRPANNDEQATVKYQIESKV